MTLDLQHSPLSWPCFKLMIGQLGGAVLYRRRDSLYACVTWRVPHQSSNVSLQAAMETWGRLLEYTISSPGTLAPVAAGAAPMLCRPKVATGVLAAVLQRLMGQPLPGGKAGVPRPQCIAEVHRGTTSHS